MAEVLASPSETTWARNDWGLGSRARLGELFREEFASQFSFRFSEGAGLPWILCQTIRKLVCWLSNAAACFSLSIFFRLFRV